MLRKYDKLLELQSNQVGNYMFKVNNKNTRTRCQL